MQTYVYILISRSSTGIAKAIRLLGQQYFSHCAISLDGELRQIYAFARPEKHAPLMGRLVHESLDRYTLRRDTSVPVVLFRIPVSQEQYAWAEQSILAAYSDRDCVYNLFSVVTYPLVKGMTLPNSYTCIEFIAYILQNFGYLQKKPKHKYTPDDLVTELDDFIVYRGDVRECMTANPGDGRYFAPFRWHIVTGSLRTLWLLTKRCFTQRA